MSQAAIIDPLAAQPTEAKVRLSALLVEDNLADAELVLRELRRGGFEVSSDVVQTANEFHRKLQATTPDVILADYNLGSWRGMEALEILRTEGRDIPLLPCAPQQETQEVQPVGRTATTRTNSLSKARPAWCSWM